MSPYNYSRLDQPEVLRVLFHPRPDSAGQPPSAATVDLEIEVAAGIRVHARFHLDGADDPHILFFHGNGETVADYDPVGPRYNAQGLNLLAVDYRGYGMSGGTPTVTSMLGDAHVILRETCQWLRDHNRRGPLLVMGRSLGCACALELAAADNGALTGLIIESGFSTTLPLLLSLGVDVQALAITEADGFRNLQKISLFTKPTYILHAQYDQLIPLANAELLQSQSPAHSK